MKQGALQFQFQSYDADGSPLIVTEPAPNSTVTYEWNDLSQLIGISYGPGLLGSRGIKDALDFRNMMAGARPPSMGDSFMYDSAGHRVKRTTGGVVTWYIYDGDTMIAQKSETGYTEYEIPGVGWVSPSGAGYSTTYTLTNQRGDTVGLAVGNQVTNIRDYDAYGGFCTLLASSDSDHRYVGGKGVTSPQIVAHTSDRSWTVMTSPYRDDPIDQIWIKRGFEAYTQIPGLVRDGKLPASVFPK